MAMFALIEYENASPEVRAIYDDIRATRKVEWINNFWKILANETNRLSNGYRIDVDDRFREPLSL